VIASNQMGGEPAPNGRRRLGASRLPERQRATYHRGHGIRYVMGACDVHDDRLRVRLRPRRSGSDNLAFMAQIRAARRRIYWIQDNLSANWTPDIRSSPRRPTPATSTPSSATSSDQRVRRQQRDYVDWDAFAWARPPPPTPQRPATRQTHPHPRNPSQDRRLMPLRVKRSEKGHWTRRCPHPCYSGDRGHQRPAAAAQNRMRATPRRVASAETVGAGSDALRTMVRREHEGT
jgi:hypothetical protein